MKKTYFVDVDLTISVNRWIDAESEEEAKRKALEDVRREPAFYASHGAYVGAEVAECYEDNEE